MDFITNIIMAAIKELEIGVIQANLEGMFSSINENMSSISDTVGRTPQEWNGTVFGMIANLSENVILPIAGLILTFVLGYEIISMVVNKNNMHEFEVSNLFQYIFKCFIAIIVVTNAWNIVNAVFALGKAVAVHASGEITSSVFLDETIFTSIADALDGYSVGKLMVLMMEVLILRLGFKIMGVLITLIVYARMIEIYVNISVAPIPFATMANREWGQMGNNYLRSIAALAFQGFFMLICVGIYAALVSNALATAAFTDADGMCSALLGLMGYTCLLCYTLFKCGSYSQRIFSAH